MLGLDYFSFKKLPKTTNNEHKYLTDRPFRVTLWTLA